jgi:adenylylsulfate kinase-like enzyme
MTGVSSPYEAPEAPEIHVETVDQRLEDCVEDVVAGLRELGYLTKL